MIDQQLASKKTRKKLQRRNGVSIVNFIGDNANFISCINDFEKSLSSELIEAFYWGTPEKYHLTVLRCSSTESEVHITSAFEKYLREIMLNNKPVNIKPKSIRLDHDGVIRLYFSGSIKLGFDTSYLSVLSNGLNFKEMVHPWITVAYSKLDSLDYLYNNKIEIDYPIKQLPFSYTISDLSIVRFYDTEFRKYNIINTIPIGLKQSE